MAAIASFGLALTLRDELLMVLGFLIRPERWWWGSGGWGGELASTGRQKQFGTARTVQSE
jgi:hypothetical protein